MDQVLGLVLASLLMYGIPAGGAHGIAHDVAPGSAPGDTPAGGAPEIAHDVVAPVSAPG